MADPAEAVECRMGSMRTPTEATGPGRMAAAGYLVSSGRRWRRRLGTTLATSRTTSPR